MRVLGVDPGCKHTGWAIVDLPARSLVAIGTIRNKGVDATQDELGARAEEHGVELVAVQVPAISGRRAPQWNKSAMSIVKNAGLACDIRGWLRGRGFRTVAVEPKARCGLKMDAKLWAKYWNHDKRCSEDARDAAQIALMGAENAR